jgi:hypothetical protein
MALRFIDGFEHYAIPSQIPLKYTSYNDSGGSSGITTMTGRRAGSTALLFRISSDFVGVTLDAQSPHGSWVLVFICSRPKLQSLCDLLIVRVLFKRQYLSVMMEPSDCIAALYLGAHCWRQSTNSLPILSWNFIEAKLTIADSGGTFEVRVNESVWVTFTGDTKQSSTQSTAVRIQIYGRGSDNAIDDLYICDGTGSTNNNYLGDVRVDTVRPIGAGNYAELSRQGSASNWDNVDDTIIDSDSSYNFSNTVGQRDTLDCGNLPSITGSIFGVQLNIAARKDDAGSRTLRSLTRVSSTDYEGASQNVGTDYRVYRQILEQNPNTAAAWTESQINTAEFGYKVQA